MIGYIIWVVAATTAKTVLLTSFKKKYIKNCIVSMLNFT